MDTFPETWPETNSPAADSTPAGWFFVRPAIRALHKKEAPKGLAKPRLGGRRQLLLSRQFVAAFFLADTCFIFLPCTA